MTEESGDLKERILQTTESLLSRYGPSKLSVVDVAREIGMSHGNIYRFFSSKSLLLAAVVQRWLEKVEKPLSMVAASDLPPDQKLEAWLDELRRIKRKKYTDDPQLLAIYGDIAAQTHDEVQRHIQIMIDQLEKIVVEGNQIGMFHSQTPRLSAAALLNATARFHHPSMVTSSPYPTEDEAKEVTRMLIRSLKYKGD